MKYEMTTREKIERLIEVCQNLDREKIPTGCDGQAMSGLTDDKITLLSMGRGHGPTPSLDNETIQKLKLLLWTDGINPTNEVYSWEGLRIALEVYLRWNLL